MPKGIAHWPALLLTLAVAGAAAFWIWTGMKSPPVHEPVVAVVTTPAGWKEFDAGVFTFYAPKYAVLRKLAEPGHVVGQIIGAGFYMKFEYGLAPNTLAAGGSGFSESEIAIGRRRAILRKTTLDPAAAEARFGTYAQPSYIGLYFPEAVRAAGSGGQTKWYSLQIEGAAQNDDLRDVVEMILKSIRFKQTD